MIDLGRFAEVLAFYKQDFAPIIWGKEKYKWEAVKHFQDNWDINASNFGEMLDRSLEKTNNLLSSLNNFPKGMIVNSAKDAPEKVRAMFIALFDENRDYWERINEFKQSASALHEELGNGKQHYQTENAITTYLWLRYPDRYYIYKYSLALNAAEELGSDYAIKQGRYADNVRNHLALYDEINTELCKDSELRKILNSNLTPECYPDTKMRTLTMDFCFYMSHCLQNKNKDDEKWWPDKSEYDFILDLVREANPLPNEKKADDYDKTRFLEDVYMDDTRYEQLRAILMHKKNVILQGAPGVGKTFCARRLAWSIMEKQDDSRIEFVQFHQNYSYEDFIMGYRPEGDTFELKHGIFYRFCQKAANQPDKPFFFIIDEINRGNMSKIFGELLMLIESDYRGTKVTLAYNGLPFSVPKNLYIIGMMNTADRSLAMIDYALRRRFSFFDMEPGFDTKGFSEYCESLGSEAVDELIGKVKDLNAEITRDKSLGKGFCIGHSYFCGRKATDDVDEWCRQVVDFDILPMLREYWFDDEAKVTRWDNILHGVFQ